MEVTGTLICRDCNIEKTLDNFYKDNKVARGCGTKCKECYKVKPPTYIVVEGQNNKACSECYQMLPLDSFNKMKRSVDGYAHKCKSCMDVPSKKRIEHIFEDGIEKKKCGKCSEYLDITNFNYSSQSWDHLRNTCKGCLTHGRMQNKDKMTEYNKKYWIETKDAQTEKSKKWRSENKEYIANKQKEYYKQNKTELNKKDYYRRKNDPNYKEYMENYRREYDRYRLDVDPAFRIKRNMRSRVYIALKHQHTVKQNSTFELVGCSVDYLVAHLEKQFKPGMTWDNYGPTWHVDHRIPCSAFDLTDNTHLYACFNYRNLQPMFATENILKSNKVDPTDLKEYLDLFNLDDTPEPIDIQTKQKILDIEKVVSLGPYNLYSKDRNIIKSVKAPKQIKRAAISALKSHEKIYLTDKDNEFVLSGDSFEPYFNLQTQLVKLGPGPYTVFEKDDNGSAINMIMCIGDNLGDVWSKGKYVKSNTTELYRDV